MYKKMEEKFLKRIFFIKRIRIRTFTKKKKIIFDKRIEKTYKIRGNIRI
jgi:hypothetical protein